MSEEKKLITIPVDLTQQLTNPHGDKFFVGEREVIDGVVVMRQTTTPWDLRRVLIEALSTEKEGEKLPRNEVDKLWDMILRFREATVIDLTAEEFVLVLNRVDRLAFIFRGPVQKMLRAAEGKP